MHRFAMQDGETTNRLRASRKAARLAGYDYSRPGGYFVTLVTEGRISRFGIIENGVMILNAAGEMIHRVWSSMPERFPNIDVEMFQVMPNHFHAIILIHDVGATLVVAQERAGTRPAPTLGDIVGAFKSITTLEYIRGVESLGWERFRRKLWQRNYYEHIIRNDEDYETIAGYIMSNPENWNIDEENPCA